MEQKTNIEIELNTEDLAVANRITKTMLKALNIEDLDLIGKMNVIQTVTEVTMTSEDFDKQNEN